MALEKFGFDPETGNITESVETGRAAPELRIVDDGERSATSQAQSEENTKETTNLEAFRKFLMTPEGKRLYEEYLKTTGGVEPTFK